MPLALDAGVVETLPPIGLRYTGRLIDLTVARNSQDVLDAAETVVTNSIITTTVRRVIVNEALPPEMPFINGLLKKKGLQQTVRHCQLRYGLEPTAHARQPEDHGLPERHEVRHLD